jgi:hypothetical protein
MGDFFFWFPSVFLLIPNPNSGELAKLGSSLLSLAHQFWAYCCVCLIYGKTTCRMSFAEHHVLFILACNKDME